MWFVPTRGRPDRLQNFLDACVETEMSMPGHIVVDGRDGGDYSQVSVPDNWTLTVAMDRVGPAKRCDKFFEEYPNEQFYSIVNDDVIPMTDGWDVILSNKCGPWDMVYPDDGNNGERMATQFLVGGDLVRAVGSFSLGFIHTQHDRAWMDIARGIGTLKYVPEVFLRHDHWTTGRSERDEVYEKKLNGKSTIKQDRFHYDYWKREILPHVVEVLKDRVYEHSSH